MNEESAARGMALIGLTVSAGAGVSPEHFLRIFGVPREDVTGSAAFRWRLFAVRTAFISGLAWRGDATARRAFLPVQLLDQAVFWHGFVKRSVPRRAALIAAGASGAIIVLDSMRRRAEQ